MKLIFTTIIIATIVAGCESGMFLRYSYNKALESLPACSKIHQINNSYITYSILEALPSETTNLNTNVLYDDYNTNYYNAYYTAEGDIYKIIKINEK